MHLKCRILSVGSSEEYQKVDNINYRKEFSGNNCKKGQRNKNTERKPDKNQMEALREFTSRTLSAHIEQYILSGHLILFGGRLYRLPEATPSLNGLKVLRAGLCIGEFKKERFEPSHALALFLGKNDVKSSEDISLTDVRLEKYLRGETIETDALKGWCLVCADGYSIGWGKVSGGQLKNHYPKGLRKNV